MMTIKIIFGPNGDLGLSKTIYSLKNIYELNAEIEFDLLYSSPYPKLQIGDSIINLEDYSDEEIRYIIKSIINNPKSLQQKENEMRLVQLHDKDFPPGSNFSEVLI
ncbi:MAG: hypothetical protein QXN58_03345 [Saccharolobus sp.]